MKKLIIHADDLGMCHSVNRAIFKSFYHHAITSASIMAPCSWFPQVVEWAKDNPRYDLGVHLTFTSEWKNYKWRPILTYTSLADKSGYFYPTVEEFLSHADPREVELETQAQIEKVLKSGITVSHVDNHMYDAKGTWFAIFQSVASKYGLKYCKIPTVIAGVRVPEHEWVNHYCAILSEVPEGISQLIVHPGYRDSELNGITEGIIQGNAESRWRDMKVLMDWDFQLHLAKTGIELATWKDV